jgi:hypothetical protein
VIASVLLVAVVLVLATPALVAAGTDPSPTKCGRDDTPGSTPGRCVGPVTDESGGGGDALTIAIGVVVGLAVAGVAFVLVRRQLASGGRAR